MRSRLTIPVISVMALSLALAGCSGGSSSDSTASGAGGKSSFEFWSFTGIDQKLAVDTYKKLNPDVSVKLTEVGSSVDTATALATALAGGKVPDLVLIQAADLPKFLAQPQNFHNLADFGAKDIAKDYLPWVWSQAMATNGAVVGVPTDVGGMAIAYRTDLFKAAGLPTDRAEVSALWPTWGDFIKVGQTYKAATGKAFLDNAATSIFLQAVQQGPEQFYDPKGKLVYTTSPQVKDAFNVSLKAIDAGITARVDSFSDGWSAGMAGDSFAALAAPSWMLGGIRNNAPDTAGKWDIATVPGLTAKDRAGNWGGSYLAIPAKAKNPEAAWKFIKQMQAPDQQLANFVQKGNLPSTPSVFKDPKLTSFTDPFFSGAPTGQIYTQSVLGLKPFKVGVDGNAIAGGFGDALKAVEQGGAPSGAAWDTALKNIKVAIG